MKDAGKKVEKAAKKAARKVKKEVLEPIEDAGKKVEKAAKKAARKVKKEVLEPIEDAGKKVEKAAKKAARKVKKEVLEPIFDGNWEVCDCSKTMQEQGVSACKTPKPACPPDSPHEMGTPQEPLEEVLETDICGLIRYVSMDGDNNTVYRGVGYGSAWIVDWDENGTMNGGVQMRIFPDKKQQYILKPNQGWTCHMVG